MVSLSFIIGDPSSPVISTYIYTSREAPSPLQAMGTYAHTKLLCFTMKFKLKEPVPPEDVEEAFLRFSGDDRPMTAEQLQRFMKEVQKEEHATIDDAERIIRRVCDELKLKKRNTLTCLEFHHYLFSAAINPPIGSEVKEDTLKSPLTHYYIFTGHNSYLKGNQLTSESCVEPIIMSLQRGVRVVELDLWPNKNNIKVVHGRTMTKPVGLIECLRAIDKHAFEASQYPVILTLEDHLPPQLQQKVAKMLRETFGEKLYIPESELQECPSPADLKGKILVSTKTPKEYYEEIEYVKGEKNNMQQDQEYDDDDDPDDDDDQDNKEKNGKDQLLKSKSGYKCRKGKRIRWNRQENRESILKRILYAIFPYLRTKYRIKAHKYESQIDGEASDSEEKLAYRELIAIHAGKLQGKLKEAFRGGHKLDKVRRVSLTEQSLEKEAIDQSHGHGITRFTENNFLRVYPKGSRLNSSNYNPFLGWMHGAQMVAFNMQGHGRHLWAMSGMFRGNGGCGYVKKPDILLNLSSANPRPTLPIKKTLKVKVYSTDGWLSDFKLTHFDAHSPPDFYVRVGIAGVPSDKRMKRTEEKMNEWRPIWNKELSFPLTVPELALLRIEVHEYDRIGDDFAGQTCLPVLELRSGIRAVPLYCRKGMPYKSVRLLMRFNLE